MALRKDLKPDSTVPEGESAFEEFESFEKVSQDYLCRGIKDTMFPSHYDESIRSELVHCLRVFPHDQDTSGFFITIIKKVKELDQPLVEFGKLGKPTTTTIEEQKVSQGTARTQGKQAELPLVIQTKNKQCSFEFTRCDSKDPDIEWIKSFYGITDDFPVEQLVTQSAEMKKLYYISPQLSKFLYSDAFSHNLNIINMGVQTFMKNSSKFGSNSECIYRISQDGVLNVLPYMTKRLITITDEDDFKQFLKHKMLDIDSITQSVKSPNLRAEISDLTAGCFILALKVGQSYEALTMHKFPRQVSLMISKEGIFSLHLRYLSTEERLKHAIEFELDK